MSDANALRTVVPPPCDVMKPVTSMPASLKYPFSRATAKGAPYIPSAQCVTVRLTAAAWPPVNIPAISRLRVASFNKGLSNMLCLLRYRSEEHTSELQSLMRISYDVFCVKKKINMIKKTLQTIH